MAGVAMYRYRLRLLPVLVLTPIAIPEILMGVALLIFFVLLNFTLGSSRWPWRTSRSASALSPSSCARGWRGWTRA